MRWLIVCTAQLFFIIFSGSDCWSYKYPMWISRHMRSSAARSLLYHVAEAQQNRKREVDLTEWYECNVSALPDDLRQKFIQGSLDEGTREFLQSCYDNSDAVLTQFGHMMFKGIFNLFMSVTTINGILSRGSMFVFSEVQLQGLMGIYNENWKAKRLLDLGAGDGKVTAVMERHFEEVYVTEQSPSMRWRLHWKGYKVLEINEWSAVDEPFDMIGCLNLLDRCDKPLTLLSDIKRVLRPDTGQVIVGVVLPFSPSVESGRSLVPPTELITVQGDTWEEQVTSLVNDVFTPAGFTVEHFTKLPYLCEGDMYESFYSLSDTVFVIKPSA